MQYGRAWECQCLFINPGTARPCAWCDQSKPGYGTNDKLREHKSEDASTTTQDGAVAPSTMVTAEVIAAEPREHAQGRNNNEMSHGLEMLTDSESVEEEAA
jgi:hypothetical protein